jgi:four helix bundle protein
VRDFKRLVVWEKAHALTLSAYRATQSFPRGELYGLTSQLRRAAASIPANVAEGYGRRGDAELAQFIGIALGSASELEYHLVLARDLGYIDAVVHEQLNSATLEVQRMLASLMNRAHLRARR